MSRAQRDKGLRGELEVKHAFALAGFTVRGLEGQGDHLMIGHRLTLHVESKRQETIRIADWSKQAEAEAPQGCIAVVCYRRSREPWRASLLLDDLLAMIVANSELLSRHHAIDAMAGALIGGKCPICRRAQ